MVKHVQSRNISRYALYEAKQLKGQRQLLFGVTPFIGRRKILEALRSLFSLHDSSAAGRGMRWRHAKPILEANTERRRQTRESESLPQSVILTGAAGLGKQRILHELRRDVELEGGLYFSSQPHPDVVHPWQTLSEILCQLAPILELVPSNTREQIETLLCDWQIFLESKLYQLSPQLKNQIVDLFMTLSEEQSIVIVFPELDHLSPQAFDFFFLLHRAFYGLGRGTERKPCVLFATWNEPHSAVPSLERRPLWKKEAGVEEFEIPPLKLEESLDLLRALFPSASLPQSLLQILSARVAGSPYLIELLAAIAKKQRAPEQASDQLKDFLSSFGGVDERKLDKRLIECLLQDLPQSAQVGLRLLALLGRPTPRECLLSTLGDEAEAAIDKLLALRLIRKVSVNRLEMKHPALRVLLDLHLPAASRSHLFDKMSLWLGSDWNQLPPFPRIWLLKNRESSAQGLFREAQRASHLQSLEAARQFFETALKRLSPGAYEDRREMLAAYSDCLIKLGRHSEARAVLFQELTVCRQLDDALARQDALARMARVNVHLRAYEQARRFFFESLKTARELSSYEGVRENLHELGQLTAKEGRLDEALAYFQESLGLLESLGQGSEKPRLFRAMARALLGKGETERALKKAREALALEQESGSPDHLVECHILLAQIHDREERPRAVLSNCEKALTQLGDRQCRDAARPLILLGSAQEKLGQRSVAKESLANAALIARRNNERDDLAWALYHQGWISSKEGKLESSLEFFNEATTLWNMLGNQSHYSLGLVALGCIYRRVGRGGRALHCYQKARRLARSHTLLHREAQATIGEAKILMDRGCYVQARHLLTHALENGADQVNSSPDATELRALYVFLLGRIGQRDSSHSNAALIQNRRCADFANWPAIERLLCLAAIERCDGAEVFRFRPMTRARQDNQDVLEAVRDRLLDARLALFLGNERSALDIARGALEQSQRLNLPLDELEALVIMVECALRMLQDSDALLENERESMSKNFDLYVETALRKAKQLGLHGAIRRVNFFLHQFQLLSGDVHGAFAGFRGVLAECQEDAHFAYDVALEVRYARSLLQMETVFQIDFVTDNQETPFQFIRRQLVEARMYSGAGLLEAAERAKEKAKDCFQSLRESLPPIQQNILSDGSRQRELERVESLPKDSSQASRDPKELMVAWLKAYRLFHEANDRDSLIQAALTKSLKLFHGRRAAFFEVTAQQDKSKQVLFALNQRGESLSESSDLPLSSQRLLVSESPRMLWDAKTPLLDLPLQVQGKLRYRLCVELAQDPGGPSAALNAQIQSLCKVLSSLLESFQRAQPKQEAPKTIEAKRKGSERLPPQRVDFNLDRPLKACLEDVERQILVRALERHDNNKTHAAKALGLSRFGFLKKLDKHGLRD